MLILSTNYSMVEVMEIVEVFFSLLMGNPLLTILNTSS
jgi:hypothetical protein